MVSNFLSPILISIWYFAVSGIPLENLKPGLPSQNKSGGGRLRVIVDVDAGVDDALALMFFLRHSDMVEVRAVTCVFGNVDLETSCNNVQRTLNFLHRTDIPVYPGADRALIPSKANGSDWNGDDGFGGNAAKYPVSGGQRLQSTPAADFIVQAVNESPGQLDLVILGPHTNLALAQRLDKTVLSKFNAIHVMGGNYGGGGKPLADSNDFDYFNFLQDPESAHLVLTELDSPAQILTIETCNANRLKWKFFENVTSYGSPKARFFRDVTQHPGHVNKDVDKQDGIELCDLYLAEMILFPELLVKQSVARSATVELRGENTRAMMIVKAMDQRKPAKETSKSRLLIATELDSRKLRDLIFEMVV